MAVQTTEEFKNGGATSYSITIEYLKASDIKVRIGGALQTYVASSPSSGQYTVSGTTVTLGAQAAAGSGNVHIYRETDVNTAAAVFAAGSSIKAADLNAIHDMGRFAAVEHRNKIITADVKEDAISSTEILDGTIVDANINASAGITLTKLGTGTLPSSVKVDTANLIDGSVNSSKITDGTIVNADVNASAAIAGTKVDPDFGSQLIATTGNLGVGGNTALTGTLSSGAHTVTGNIAVSGTVDGRDVATDGTKLDTIETNAKDDQTAAEIKTLLQSNKLTDSEIATGTLDNRYYTETELNNGQLDNRYFTETEIANGAADTRYYTEAELNGGQLNTLYFTESEITGGAADGRYYTETELDAGQLDNRYFTETELTGGALDGRYYTETEAEALFLRQDSSETIASGDTWSNTDSKVATTAAINARIVDLIDDVGGFIAIANQTSFPATNPQGTAGQAAILSIGATTATLTPSGTTLTIANGAGTGNTVTVTGVTSAIPTGFGFLVESTSTLHTYTFHRLVPKATEVTTVATNITNIAAAGANVADINNFADLYQISNNAPSQRADGTSLQDGDLWFDNSNDNLRVYDGTNWAIVTPAQSVLNDIAIVSGAITYQEDLGLISDSVTTGSSNGSLDIVADILEDEATFTVTASGGAFLIDGVSKPALTLYKGWTYTFDLSSNTLGTHPLRFSSGGSLYSTNVTVTGTQGQAGAKVVIKIPESQPTSFAYYCTNHSGMGNTITVKDDPIKTVSDNITNIITVASDLTEGTSEIDTVANNITNVNNVGNNISNVNSVHSNASNINSAVSNATNINSVAGSISNVNTVATNISNVNDFSDKYRVASSAPTSNNDAGDLYFDTTANELKVYNGSSWQGGVTTTGNLAGLGANQFSGNITFTGSQTVDGRDVSVDGAKLDTIESNATADQTASEIVTLIAGQTIAPNVITTTNLTLDFGSIA